MFKTISSYFVIFFFSTYTLSAPIIWATYFVYQDYIAEEFCVNKSNPDCCGSCYIIEIEDEKPVNNLPKIEVRTPELTSFILLRHFSPKDHPSASMAYAPHSAGNISTGYTSDIHRPPESLLQTI
jgi:hypothetical protein